jgi:2,5-dihydroxypyridine 5,6-dioxygenase
MLIERIEAKWIDAFARTFDLSEVRPGDVCAILSETQSRPILVQLAELGLQRCGATVFHIVLPTPELDGPIPVRSTGSSHALRGIRQVVDALAASALVVDCTVEGLLHSPERAAILGGGARIMMISNEHPEVLERLQPDPELGPKVAAGVAMLDGARKMTVTSVAGTRLTIDVAGAPARGSAGMVTKPGTISYWPAGLCLCFPRAGSVNGVLVLAPGDANLTFKSYVRDPITLTIKDDYITRIEGDHLDGELMRSYLQAWTSPPPMRSRMSAGE